MCGHVSAHGRTGGARVLFGLRLSSGLDLICFCASNGACVRDGRAPIQLGTMSAGWLDGLTHGRPSRWADRRDAIFGNKRESEDKHSEIDEVDLGAVHFCSGEEKAAENNSENIPSRDKLFPCFGHGIWLFFKGKHKAPMSYDDDSVCQVRRIISGDGIRSLRMVLRPSNRLKMLLSRCSH